MPSEKKTPEEVRQLLLDYLDANNEVADTLKFASEQGLEHQEVVGAVKSLETKDELISTKDIKTPSWVLSDEGNQIAEEGSHEAKVFNAIPATGITQDELMKVGAYAKIGFGKAVKNGWIALDKSSKPPMVTRDDHELPDHQGGQVLPHCGETRDRPDCGDDLKRVVGASQVPGLQLQSQGRTPP
eukprot:Colp12_sorted_trinity150504_noHs@7040